MYKKMFATVIIAILLVVSLLTACSQTTSSTTKSTTGIPVQTSSTTTTQATQAHWWDKFGTPQYGGELNQAVSQMPGTFDTISFMSSGALVYSLPFFEPDWTVDPDVYQTYLGFVPEKYCAGNLAESWEFTDSQTFTVKIRKGVLWQNKDPVNGREFVASDIEAHYVRAMGPNSMVAGMMSSIESVTAADNYTVVFKFKTPSSGSGFHLIRDLSGSWESPEWAALSDQERLDWRNVTGAGAWIITGFTESSTLTYAKNPDYSGADPRYPENKVPYADTFTTLCIPDTATQLAALRTGQIDVLSGITATAAEALKNSNTELVVSDAGVAAGTGVQFRLGLEPFSDIRVRTALQMALDNKAIADSFYKGLASETPAAGALSPVYEGWAYTYENWPQSLKDEYTYNPEGAKQLLADAGYPNGFKTNVVQSNGLPFGGADSVEIMQLFKSYFMAIGVDMEIRVMDGVTAENYMRSRQTDAMYGAHTAATFPPIRVIDMYWSGGSDAAMMDLDILQDPVYDAAREKFISASTEEEAQAAMYEADRRVIEQHWNVAVSSAGTFIFSQPYLKGYDWRTPLNWTRLWVDQSLKK